MELLLLRNLLLSLFFTNLPNNAVKNQTYDSEMSTTTSQHALASPNEKTERTTRNTKENMEKKELLEKTNKTKAINLMWSLNDILWLGIFVLLGPANTDDDLRKIDSWKEMLVKQRREVESAPREADRLEIEKEILDGCIKEVKVVEKKAEDIIKNRKSKNRWESQKAIAGIYAYRELVLLETVNVDERYVIQETVKGTKDTSKQEAEYNLKGTLSKMLSEIYDLVQDGYVAVLVAGKENTQMEWKTEQVKAGGLYPDEVRVRTGKVEKKIKALLEELCKVLGVVTRTLRLYSKQKVVATISQINNNKLQVHITLPRRWRVRERNLIWECIENGQNEFEVPIIKSTDYYRGGGPDRKLSCVLLVNFEGEEAEAAQTSVANPIE